MTVIYNTVLLYCPQLFRRTLVRMFESQDLDCVFMETHMNPRKRQHMVLECIPLPRELGDMAPIYFKVCMCTGFLHSGVHYVKNRIQQSVFTFRKLSWSVTRNGP